MDLPVGRRAATLLAVPATLAVGLLAPSAGHASTAATPTVTVSSPAQGARVTAGAVTLAGSTTVGADTLPTSVMFVVDTSASAVEPDVRGKDCNGDGVFTPSDDLNGDGSAGDVLDCEIGAVKALNRGLAGLGGGLPVQVGITEFAGSAATASFDATADVPFVPSTALTDAGASKVDTVANSLGLLSVKLYQPKKVLGGTNFDAPIEAALPALAAQPSGPKWVVLLSDGVGTLADTTVSKLAASGVHLRSFAVGASGSCSTTGALWRLANATGDSCIRVPDQASLTSHAITSQPKGIARVDVGINGRTLAADVDPFGGWKARVTLPAGTFTAIVTATSPAGRVYSAAPRTFTVVPSTTSAPKAPIRPALVVDTPAATYAALPSRVTGRATYRDPSTRQTVLLNGVRVALQARTVVHGHSRWGTVATSTVVRGGYALGWTVRPQARSLRVVLSPVAGVSGAVVGVQHPVIYGCSIHHPSRHAWVTTCHTTAPRGSKAVLRSSRVLARGTVSSAHTVRLVTARDAHRLTVVVTPAHARSVALHLPARG